MGKNLVYYFHYMCGDELCSTVYVYDDDSVVVDDKVDFIGKLPFGMWGSEVTVEDVEEFFESRCFPRTRANCRQLLKDAGLDFYNPNEIVRITRGRMSDDEFWLDIHDFLDGVEVDYNELRKQD